MAIPKFERGLMDTNKRKGQANVPELRSRLACIDKAIYLFCKGERNFITVKELRAILRGCSIEMSITNLCLIIREGQIRQTRYPYRLGRMYMLYKGDLLRWLKWLEERGIESLSKRGLVTVIDEDVNKLVGRG